MTQLPLFQLPVKQSCAGWGTKMISIRRSFPTVEVYTQCIVLHIICDPGTINIMMKSDINKVYVTYHEWWESCSWKMNYRKAIMSTVSISLSWLTSMSDHRPTQDARVHLNWAMSCWCTFQSNNFWSQLFRRDLSSHKVSTNNDFLQFGRGGCVLDLIWSIKMNRCSFSQLFRHYSTVWAPVSLKACDIRHALSR